jgi:hypothetical protein
MSWNFQVTGTFDKVLEKAANFNPGCDQDQVSRAMAMVVAEVIALKSDNESHTVDESKRAGDQGYAPVPSQNYHNAVKVEAWGSVSHGGKGYVPARNMKVEIVPMRFEF